jgi:outer membrane receptor protein involved in Fe transport
MHWSAGVHWQYVDDHFAGGTELSPQIITEAYDLIDARLTLSSADHAWSATLFGQNLTDERYPVHHFTQVLGAALGLVDTTTGETVYRHYLSAPRTYGLRLRNSF